MRKIMPLLLWLAASLLQGVPVAKTIINSRVYHASASETRCITAFHNSSVSNNLTHITLWDISNPAYPRQGVTITSGTTWGQHFFRQPTVLGNLLFYLDSYRVRIVDISNADIPVHKSQLPISYTQSFVVWDHYLAAGTTDGTILTYDISDPAQPQLVSTSIAGACIFRMWLTEDKLGISRGISNAQTAALYQWQESTQSFSELTSVLIGCEVTYVGATDGRMVARDINGVTSFYGYTGGGAPTLDLQFSNGYNIRQVLAQGDRFYARSENNCLRVWELDANASVSELGHYDLSHLSSDPGILYELRGSRLVYTVSDMILIILDVSDPTRPPELLDSYNPGINISNLGIPAGGNSIYFTNEYRLSHLKLDASGMLSPGEEIQDVGWGRYLQSLRDNLYLSCGTGENLRLKVINFSDPEAPATIYDQPVEYTGFLLKDDALYMGSIIDVEKYRLDEDGVPVYERNISYLLPDNGFDVMFVDFASYQGSDYGIGIFGDMFYGYYSVLVTWLPNGTVHLLYPPFLLYRAFVVADKLYLTSNGINILDISGGIPRLESTLYLNNLTKGVECSLYLRDRYLLQCYEASNQIGIYDLGDPSHPRHIHTICQSHATKAMGIIGNRLVCASGNYGIEIYDLPISLADPETDVPPTPGILATPNPFSSSVSISFSLPKPSPATLDIYNIRGQKVFSRALSNPRAGENTLTWDGKDSQGRSLPPGIYILRVHGGGTTATRKITKL